MKIIWISFLLASLSCGKQVVCLIPENLKSQIVPIFTNTSIYNHIKINVQEVSFENTLLNFMQSNEIKFAIVRRDILWQIQQHKKYGQKDNFFILSQLPYRAQLYLLTKDKTSEIKMLSNQMISVGNIKDENNNYLKSLLELYQLKYNVFYKSYAYKQSLHALKKDAIDAYFTFLPQDLSIDNNFHAQKSFSKEVIQYFEDLEIFEIDYTGIFTPYMLVASIKANDEEIENMIYRLMERELFNPVTDQRYGVIDKYLMRHIESAKIALQKTGRNKGSKICREYHYGFLKLLRLKPKLKKKLRYFYSTEKELYLKQINDILIAIDAHKEECDLGYLENKKKQFLTVEKKIKNAF